MKKAQAPQFQKERKVRVFISSTFTDMHSERDELVKKVFPRLRKLCEERGVEWGEVDLRWGVTEKDKAEGKVLPICLQEIDRTRPYFIGLLGERYGWVPEDEALTQSLIKLYPWIKYEEGHSVTSMEIHYGVLKNKQAENNAFFYFRNQEFLGTIAKRDRWKYVEAPTTEEVQKYGREEATRRANTRKEKLEHLKLSIKKSGLPLKNFQNAEHLGELVRKDLEAIIEKNFPAEETPSSLDKERMAHEAFARSRFNGYVSGDKYFASLDKHVLMRAPPLVVLGTSGVGKSALLANWAKQYQKKHPADAVVMHFIGASAQSTDWAAMLNRISQELQQRFNLHTQQIEETHDSERIKKVFQRTLLGAASKARIILVIDALNQLEDREGAPDLLWLPETLADNVHVVVSTLPGRSLIALQKRKCPTLAVAPLTRKEQKQFIFCFLHQYGKKMESKYCDQITSAPQARNPLFLRVLLDELRVHGDLSGVIGHYLQAKEPEALFGLVLARLEQDYETEFPGLVGKLMSLLWVSRKGLSEIELRDLLGSRDAPLNNRLWSPLYLAIEHALVNHGGLLNFFHDYLRKAVEHRYIRAPIIKRVSLEKLIHYFKNSLFHKRMAEELPWHLGEMHQWKQLADLLRKLEFLCPAWKINRFEILQLWSILEKSSKYRRKRVYDYLLTEKRVSPDDLEEVIELLTGTGDPDLAISLTKRQAVLYKKKGNLHGYCNAIASYASIAIDRDTDVHLAIRALSKAERISFQRRDWAALLENLLVQTVHYIVTDTPKTRRILARVHLLALKTHNRDALGSYYHDLAYIETETGNVEKGLSLYRKAERISQELGDVEGVEIVRGNIGWTLFDRRNLSESLALFEHNITTYRLLGDLDGLGVAYACKGAVLLEQDEPIAAAECFDESMRHVEELKTKEWKPFVLGYKGLVAHDNGNPRRAKECLKESVLIFRQQNEAVFRPFFLCHLADMLRQEGQSLKATELVEEAIKVATVEKKPYNLGLAHLQKAYLLLEEGKVDTARQLIATAEKRFRKLGYPDATARAISAKAFLAMKFYAKPKEAARYRREALTICRKYGLRRLEKELPRLQGKTDYA